MKTRLNTVRTVNLTQEEVEAAIKKYIDDAAPKDFEGDSKAEKHGAITTDNTTVRLIAEGNKILSVEPYSAEVKIYFND